MRVPVAVDRVEHRPGGRRSRQQVRKIERAQDVEGNVPEGDLAIPGGEPALAPVCLQQPVGLREPSRSAQERIGGPVRAASAMA